MSFPTFSYKAKVSHVCHRSSGLPTAVSCSLEWLFLVIQSSLPQAASWTQLHCPQKPDLGFAERSLREVLESPQPQWLREVLKSPQPQWLSLHSLVPHPNLLFSFPFYDSERWLSNNLPIPTFHSQNVLDNHYPLSRATNASATPLDSSACTE